LLLIQVHFHSGNAGHIGQPLENGACTPAALEVVDFDLHGCHLNTFGIYAFRRNFVSAWEEVSTRRPDRHMIQII
jgi:hypothetical protein